MRGSRVAVYFDMLQRDDRERGASGSPWEFERKGKVSEKISKVVEEKAAVLVKTTRQNTARVKTKDNAPFVSSAAKYYPALKKLASR